MIKMDELISEQDWYEHTDADMRSNLYRLHYAMNVFRIHYAKPMIVNSGFRSRERHEKIYEGINHQRKLEGKPPVKVPYGSMHLRGAACDIRDRDGALRTWISQNLEVAENLGLYFESFDYTPTWVHFQILPPRSLNRFFRPW